MFLPPSGFNPLDFNSLHPGPFDDNVLVYQNDNGLPEGEYTVQLTDACGDIIEQTIEILELENISSNVFQITEFNGCISFDLLVSEVVSLTLTSAPDTYNETLPQDLTSQLSDDSITLNNLPQGVYIFDLEDTCGVVSTVEVNGINTSETPPFQILQRPDCEIGFGSVRLQNSVAVANVNIIQAPTNFTETLPFAVAGASSNTVYLSDVPQGNYVIEFSNACGVTEQQTISVEGYQISQNDFNLTPRCGGFELEMTHISNGNFNQSFWLQKFYPNSNSWGHPNTGVLYNDGNIPNNSNSVQLTNNFNNLNLNFTGEFRILKRFQNLTSTGTLKNCINQIENFIYDDTVFTIQLTSVSCNGQVNSVVSVNGGIAPYTYEIVSKDGQPFFIDNGSNNLFENLESGIYGFRITDDCSNVNVINAEVVPVILELLGDDEVCDNGTLNMALNNNLSFATFQWYLQSDPTNILSTNFNLEITNIDASSQLGIYVLEVQYDASIGCDPQLFEKEVTQIQTSANPGEDYTESFCNPNVTLDLEDLIGVFDNGGVWRDFLNQIIIDTQIDLSSLPLGTNEYTYTIFDDCNIEYSTTVTFNIVDKPDTPTITVVSPQCSGEDITISANQLTDAIYDWTGPNGFQSNEQNLIFSNADSSINGIYTLIVTQNGCVSEPASIEINVLETPSFTLNTDTYYCADNTSSIQVIDLNYDVAEVDMEWYLDNNLISIDSTNSFEIFNSGVYTLIVNYLGCSFSQTLTVSELPTIPIIDIQNICETESLLINIPSITEFSYSWTGPNDFVSNEALLQINSVNLNDSGNYNLTITYLNCEVSNQDFTLNVKENPQFSILGNNQTCLNQFTDFEIIPDNFNLVDANINWIFNNNTISNNNSISVNNYGTYTAQVEIDGCSTLQNITLSLRPTPFEFSILQNCDDDRTILSIETSQTIQNPMYEWTGSDGFFSTSPTVDITGLIAGEYFLTITDIDGCQNTASIEVERTLCDFPNFFSPNGDQINDKYNLAGFNVKLFEVYNRWGKLVYQRKNYTDEWNGFTGQGKVLPAGTPDFRNFF